MCGIVGYVGPQDARDVVLDGLRRLPPRMRQVLLLWSEGFTYREMADIAGIEPGYIGVLLQRSRAAFKKEFESAGSESGRKHDGV